MYKRLAVFLLAAAGLLSAAPARVLIISGRSNHDWRTTTPYLRTLLDRTGRFEVRVEEEPAGVTAATLANYDVLVLDYQGPRWGDTTEKAVVDFVRSGKGLVLVHGALYSFSGFDILGPHHQRTGRTEPVWKDFADMAGGTWAGAEPKDFHAPRHLFDVRFVAREHPVARGCGEKFSVADELYHGLRMAPSATVIATAYDDPANGGSGRNEPVLWTEPYGQGRVFATVLGHEVPAMQEPGFAVTFVRGVEWAATGAVTLPAALPEVREARPVRVELVTGGHSHDPDFYSVFVDRTDLAVNVNPHPDAFRHDLRSTTDVLVLYDMVQASSLDAARRTNLRDFVEGGKGLVVLHHAIADYTDWPWWSEQVAGGKYLLKPEGGRPGSTYKHDEDMYVEVAAAHPVTRGLGPLHLRDETYKGMWISPDVKVLLRTTNPTSDGPVAWISPYAKSRVIYIEPGHDHLTHSNPDYRELVHRAILWAAGRLN
jgi:type 1 glutamine amidotransferase